VQDSDKYLSEAFIKSLHAQVVEMKGDMQTFSEATQRNADAIQQIEKNTSDVVELFRSLEGGFKVLQGIGKLAKPLAYIAMAISAGVGAWAAVRGILK